MSSLILAVLKIGQILGAADAAIQIGEAVGHHTGILNKNTKIVPAFTGFVLHALGARPREAAAPVAALGHASPDPATATPLLLGGLPEGVIRLCSTCQSEQRTPFTLSGTERGIVAGLCELHEQEARAAMDRVDAMYLGWAEAWGIDVGKASVCGVKPIKESYKNEWGNVQGNLYQKAIADWQACVQNEKAADKDAQKAIADAKKAQKTAEQKAAKAEQAADKARRDSDKLRAAAAVATERQRAGFARREATLKTNYEKATTEQERAALKAEIDQLRAAQEQSEKLLEQSQRDATDADMRAQIDRLNREIVDRAKEPASSDQSLQQMLMMVAMQNMMPAAAPAMDPAAMAAEPAAAGLPWDAGVEGGEGDEQGSDTIADVASELGFEGVDDDEDLEELMDLRLAGWDEDSLKKMQAALQDPGGFAGCSTGCGLPRIA
jgi:flagellar biosynthesis GTPase FlhF